MSVTGAIANDTTRIKNSALRLVGIDPVGVDEGVTTERGRILASIWEDSWEYALEQDRWNFARKRAVLTFYPDSDLDLNVDIENTCQYHKPHDYVRGYGLGCKDNLCCHADEHVNFMIVNGRLILDRCSKSSSCCCSCLQDHDAIYYVANSISVAETSAVFRKYIAHIMAIELHRRYRSDDRSLSMLETKAKALLKEAKDLDRAERNTVKKEEINKPCFNSLNPFNKNRSGYL